MEKESARPIDYWVCKATDRFTSDTERTKALDFIIESIQKDPLSSLLSVDLLSHKLSSPSPEEALLTISALDYLVRNGGEKVHERCGRYRFLNELVRLIAPKYMGKMTSDTLKTEIIKLLFIWQLSIKHIPKYKQVYDSLKMSKIITEDPSVKETEIPVFQAPPARTSVFDDEEQALLLKSLLSSNRPEDLETANNLIKSLVQTEEHKQVKLHDRRRTLDQARDLCKTIEMLKLDKTADAIGLGSFNEESEQTLQTLIEKLTRLRTTIFGYANELAEDNDPALEEVLSVNDAINKALPSEERKVSNRVPTSAKAQLEPESQELLVFNSPTNEKPPKNGFVDPRDLEGSLLNNMIESEYAEEPKVIPPPVQQMAPNPNRNSSSSPRARENSIFETDFLAGQRIPEAPKPPTLNELKPCTTITLEALDVFVPAATPEPTSLSPKTIPETISLNPGAVIIRNRQPLVILDSKGVRILLYWCQSDLSTSNILSYVIVVQNQNNFTIKDVALSLSTNDKNVIIRLENLTKDLSGFNIFGQQETINLLLCIQQLNDVKDVELDFTLEYKRNLESAISGSFILTLVPEHTFNLKF